jgi:hypothetical protein
MTTATARDAEAELHDVMAQVATDPLAFVQMAYPWGEPNGPLAAYQGPDRWQADLLQEIGQQVRARAFDGVHAVLPIRVAVSSGRGVGKGALTAWLVNWIMSTRRNAVGTVTANTNEQLTEKTWAAIRTWTRRCLTAHWFEINSQVLYRKGYRDSWKVTPASCAPENSEAFQGQHNAASTSFMIFDEASGIDEKIFAAAEGGLTDGEPMMFLWFNPTRNTGYAWRAVFGSGRDRWTTRVVDARTCAMPNQAFLAEWLEDCGGDEDADFFRVHVRGLPPRADETQFIDRDRITAAQQNQVQVLAGEPLILGVDVSGGGAAWTVGRFRRGLDARSVPPFRLSGAQTVVDDRALLVATVAEAIRAQGPDAVFIDSAFGSPLVTRLRELGFTHVIEVNFGATAVDKHDDNQRATMWRKLKDWLPRGAIDTRAMDFKGRLATDLAAPGYHIRKNRLVIESKDSMAKRGVASPDDADALALTFALPVMRQGAQVGIHGRWLPAGGWQD